MTCLTSKLTNEITVQQQQEAHVLYSSDTVPNERTIKVKRRVVLGSYLLKRVIGLHFVLAVTQDVALRGGKPLPSVGKRSIGSYSGNVQRMKASQHDRRVFISFHRAKPVVILSCRV